MSPFLLKLREEKNWRGCEKTATWCLGATSLKYIYREERKGRREEENAPQWPLSFVTPCISSVYLCLSLIYFPLLFTFFFITTGPSLCISVTDLARKISNGLSFNWPFNKKICVFLKKKHFQYDRLFVLLCFALFWQHCASKRTENPISLGRKAREDNINVRREHW